MRLRHSDFGDIYYGWKLSWYEQMRNPKPIPKKRWVNLTTKHLDLMKKIGIVLVIPGCIGIVLGFFLFAFGIYIGLYLLPPSILFAILGFVLIQTSENISPDISDEIRYPIDEEINSIMLREHALHEKDGRLKYQPPSFGILCPFCMSRSGNIRPDGVAICTECNQSFVPGHKI